MDKLSPFLELGVHNKGHEVVLMDHSFKRSLHEDTGGIFIVSGFTVLGEHLFGLLLGAATQLLLLLVLILLLDFEEILQGVEQRLVPVGHSEICNSGSIFDEFKEVLVVLDRLLSNLVVHRCHGETVDLLNDGVGLFAILVLPFATGLSSEAIIAVHVRIMITHIGVSLFAGLLPRLL